MKPTLILSMAILLSATGLAQTSVKNHESVKSVTAIPSEKGSSEMKNLNSVSTSADADIQPTPVNNTQHKITENIKSRIDTKQDVIAKSAVSPQVTVSAVEHLELTVAEVKKSNKIDKKAYLTNGVIISPATIKNNHKVATSATVKNSTQVKAGMNKPVIKADHKMQATSATTVKPASIKMNTHLKGNSGIKIK